MLQQRPPGHRTLPRVRHGPADGRRGQFLLRQVRPPRPARVVPHHGTLLRVSADGSRTDIIATASAPPTASASTTTAPSSSPTRKATGHRKTASTTWSPTAASTATCSATPTSPTPPTPPCASRWPGSPMQGPVARRTRPRAGMRMGPARRITAQPQLRLRPKIFIVPHESVDGQLAGRPLRAADPGLSHRRDARPFHPPMARSTPAAWSGLGNQLPAGRRLLPPAPHRPAGPICRWPSLRVPEPSTLLSVSRWRSA
jgi:hypothetical protein